MSPRDPERELLAVLVGEATAKALAGAPGGWRSLSDHELDSFGLSRRAARTVLALQTLTRRGYPDVPLGRATCPELLGRTYGERLGGDVTERLLVLGLDGQNRILGEFEVAHGGSGGAAVTPADVFRPLIRSGAVACILIHNHPSGSASPSSEDVAMTRAVRDIGAVLSVPLLDHIIVGARGGGWVSLFERGLFDEEARHERAAE